jgi:hypothetical protein
LEAVTGDCNIGGRGSGKGEEEVGKEKKKVVVGWRGSFAILPVYLRNYHTTNQPTQHALSDAV